MKALLAICLLAAGLHAHPLDDRADLRSEVVLLEGARLELAVEFHYKDVRESYKEFNAGLDRNGDGSITRAELDQRYIELLDPMMLALTVNVDGKPALLESDAARFEFGDLDHRELRLGTRPLPTNSWRIFYRFVFDCTPRDKASPGEHKVEFLVSGAQTVVHTPREQMVAIDARAARKPVEGATWDNAFGGLPRVTFVWRIEGQAAPPPAANAPAVNVPTPAQKPLPAKPPPQVIEPAKTWPETAAPRGYGEVPAWMTLVSGAALAMCGLVLLVRNLAAKPRGKLTSAIMLLLCGAAIILGALMRLGYIATL